MYCTQPAARQFGPADQAEPTASGPVVGSLTPASAEMREACHEGQHGLRSGPAPAPLFMTSARQPSSARHAGGEQRVTGIDQVGQLGRPETQFRSRSANPRLKPARPSSTPAEPATPERDDGRSSSGTRHTAGKLLGVRARPTGRVDPKQCSRPVNPWLCLQPRTAPFEATFVLAQKCPLRQLS